MNRQQYGMLTIVSLGMSSLIGLFSILRYSILLAVLYLCILGMSVLVMLYSFCGKCRCRDTTCGHVIPGMLTGYLPRRMSGRYTAADQIGVVFPAAISLLFPQYWLVRDLWFFSAFWILFIGTVMGIRGRVCPGCTNRYCPCRIVPLKEKEPDQPETETPG